MSNLRWLGLLRPMAVLAFVTFGGLGLFGRLTSHAVQNPTISLDMISGDNTYDESTNTMSVVYNTTTDFCLASAVANAATHTHAAHLIVQNVVDLVGWQARLNYMGDQMRPSTQNATPFTDNATSQNIGFTKLPVDQGTLLHRDVTTAAAIPPAAPGPQTALIGATYNGTPTTPISPDTPAKAVPDDTSYSAPTGGILTQINLQVVGNHSGQTLYIDLSDDVPNPPGSNIVYFDGTGTQAIALGENSLSDGQHVEGGACQPATSTPTASPTPNPPTPSPSPTPYGVEFSVDSMADEPDANPGDGSCETASAQCTLRAAVGEANALPGPDTVRVPAGTYAAGFDITDNLTISGASAAQTVIDGAGHSRVFVVSCPASVSISDLTIRGGYAGYGGGIFNYGRLNLSRVVMTGNVSFGGGGAIDSTTSGCTGAGLAIFDSTLSDNEAGVGGAMRTAGPTTLTNTTISG